MEPRSLPYTRDFIEELAREFPTPFYVYDEAAIRANAQRLNRAFSWAPNFREFFAVKATPNPHILKILAEEGFGTDCSSGPELRLSEAVGLRGEDVMFTSNNTKAEEYRRAIELGAIVNLDDITHIDYLEREVGLPKLVCARYNPGELRDGNAIIGKPSEAKYGFTRDQVHSGFERLAALGVERFGLHAMVVSNELDPQVLVENARMLFKLAREVHDAHGIRFEFVNVGGGVGIPYHPDQQPVDLEAFGEGVREAYGEWITGTGLDPLAIFMENGRCITGPYGTLVTRAIHRKEIYRDYIGVDACMANLMRPGMYEAYHHITVLGKENEPANRVYDVVGSLCENNDKFAIQRPLPQIEVGDLLAIHDAGAHGHAMGFQYNGKLRCAELLLQPDGDVRMIRRAETEDDYFATLEYDGL